MKSAEIRFTKRDRKLFDLLTRKLRVVEDEQIFFAFTKSPRGSRLAYRLRRWHDQGLIQRTQAVVRMIAVVEPIATWQLGLPLPDFDAVSWRLQRRWQIVPRPVSVSWATSRAAELFGGVGGRLRQPLQLEHDLGTASVYFRRLQFAPDAADAWIGEDIYRREHRPPRRFKVPDAVLLDGSGAVRLAVEFGGAYPAERVRSFHRFCVCQRLPYEIW